MRPGTVTRNSRASPNPVAVALAGFVTAAMLIWIDAGAPLA